MIPALREQHHILTTYTIQTSSWTVQIQPSNSSTLASVESSRLILCSGSTPKSIPLPIPGVEITEIALDTGLTPSILGSQLPQNAQATVAVIGSSHSAILVLMNLFNLASTSHPQLRVKWFSRSSLLYAEYKDGWILYDNTGLKGQAAEFAQDNLEEDKLPSSPVGKFISRVDTSKNERQQYQAHLPECSHIIHATGFSPNPLPTLTKNGKPLGEDIRYDHEKGGFADRMGEQIRGLFGAGIAFPERVTDPAGNTEYSVGLWKFMKFLKKVSPDWIKA
jgi:hypothetical protein